MHKKKKQKTKVRSKVRAILKPGLYRFELKYSKLLFEKKNCKVFMVKVLHLVFLHLFKFDT